MRRDIYAVQRIERTRKNTPLIRELRRRGFTVGQVAEELKVTPAHLYKVEAGASEISLPRLRRFARLLGVTLDEADRILHHGQFSADTLDRQDDTSS